MAKLTLKGRLDPGEGRVLLTMALGIAAVEGTRPTASYRAIELGAGNLEVGIVAGAFATLAFMAALPLGRAIDRLGERRFLVIGAALLILSSVIGWGLPFIVALVLMQAVLGLGQVCMSISAQTLAGNSAKGAGDHRFARLSVAVAFGHLLGPLLAGVVIDGGLGGVLGSGTSGALVLMGCFGLGAIALAMTAKPSGIANAGHQGPTNKVGIGQLLRVGGMPQAMYVGIVGLTTMDLMVAYLPVIGENRGISPSIIGYLLATRAAATILSRLSMGALLVAFGRRRLLLIAMAISAVSVCGIAFAFPVPFMFVLMAVAGFFLGVGMPMTTAWVSSRAPEGSRGIALAVRMTGNRVSQVVVPMALGVVAAGLGAGAIFVASGAGLAVASLLVRTAPIGDD